MVKRLAASMVLVLGVTGYINLGCRPLPAVTGSTPATETVALAAAVRPQTMQTTTTTTAVPAPAPLPAPAPQKASRSAVRPRPRFSGPTTNDVWAALSRCEAGGRPDAVSRNGKYFGAFQFSIGSWHGVGMAGSPIDYPYETQLEAAKRLQARSGWGQWPVCSRKLGLR